MSDEDLKSYIKSYYLDRKMTYTKLDKHDRAIGVLLNENQQLKEEKKKAIEYIKHYRMYEELNGKDYLKDTRNYGLEDYQLDNLLYILGDKE